VSPAAIRISSSTATDFSIHTITGKVTWPPTLEALQASTLFTSCAVKLSKYNYLNTHTFRSAGTRKVKPIWILLKQETVSGINWAICKSAPRSRQITTPAPHHSFTGRMPFLLSNQQHQSCCCCCSIKALKAINIISTLYMIAIFITPKIYLAFNLSQPK